MYLCTSSHDCIEYAISQGCNRVCCYSTVGSHWGGGALHCICIQQHYQRTSWQDQRFREPNRLTTVRYNRLHRADCTHLVHNIRPRYSHLDIFVLWATLQPCHILRVLPKVNLVQTDWLVTRFEARAHQCTASAGGSARLSSACCASV